MYGLLAGYRRVLLWVGEIERVLGVALIGTMVATITTQVFTRYLLNRPIIWVEESATYAFIWGTFIGASLGLKHGRHVRIETYVSHLSETGQRASRILVNLIVLTVLWLLVGEVGKVIAIEGRSTSVSLPLPIPRAWFYSIPLTVSCVSMMATCVYLILADAAGIDTRRGLSGGPATGGVQV